MIAQNNKISTRQITRWLILAITGMLTCMLPTILAAECGVDGSISIVGGIVAGLGVVMLTANCCSMMETDYYSFLRKSFGNKLGDICQLFYLVYFIALGGYALFVLSDMVLQKLLYQESFIAVLIALLCIMGYSIYTGIESSARVYEIVFGVLTVLLCVILIFSVDDVNGNRYRMLCTEPVDVIAFGGYRILGIMSWCTFLLFFFHNCNKTQELNKVAFVAVLTAGCMMLLLYLILIGAYGSKALGETPYAVVVLMSMVKLPGGFLERLDAVVVGIWFFALYALIEMLLHHSITCASWVFGVKRKRYISIAVILAMGILVIACRRSMLCIEVLQRLFYYMAVPISVLIPLVAYLRGKYLRLKEKRI